MDRALLEQTYLDHADQLWRYLVRRTRDADVADELLSQTFLRALRADGWQDRGVPISAWLYRIAHACLVDYYRSARRRPALLPIEACLSSDDGGIGAAEVRLDAGPLYEAIDALPPRAQTVIRQRFLQGRSLSEVGQAMGCSAGAVKALQHRALLALRARMVDTPPPAVSGAAGGGSDVGTSGARVAPV